MAITETQPIEPLARRAGSRAAARRQVILDAAIALLMEVGYDRMSMDALAERAHAGKATIYRHWSGKAEVVATATLGTRSGMIGRMSASSPAAAA